MAGKNRTNRQSRKGMYQLMDNLRAAAELYAVAVLLEEFDLILKEEDSNAI